MAATFRHEILRKYLRYPYGKTGPTTENPNWPISSRGFKKVPEVARDFFTIDLKGHGSLKVDLKSKKTSLQLKSQGFQYPARELYISGKAGWERNKSEFDRFTVAAYGPVQGKAAEIRNGIIKIDYSKTRRTNDLDQTLYGDKILANPMLNSHVPEDTKEEDARRTDGVDSDQENCVREPVSEVHYSAYLTSNEDELAFGSRIKSFSSQESPESRLIANEEIEVASAETVTEATGTWDKASDPWLQPPPWKTKRASGTTPVKKKSPKIPLRTKTLVPAPGTKAQIAESTFQVVELTREGDLKALPQAPLLNKLRPNYLTDAVNVSLPGAVVLKICPEVLLGRPLAPEQYPSVTTILDVTMPLESRARLDIWKARKIAELGEEGFKVFQEKIFSDGRGFHTAVESVLKGAQVETVEVPERNEGHWQSLRHVFKDISEVVSVEERIRHPFLCYKGVTDCVISLEGQQSVVEWKTSSTRKDTIEALYDNPIQVAAYLGAINFDENFADRKLQVSNGAVIVAYNSGEPASVVRFDYSLVRPFWALWLKRLQQYWRLASFDKSLPARKV